MRTAATRIARALATSLVLLAAACGEPSPAPATRREAPPLVGRWVTERAAVEGPDGAWNAVPLDLRVRIADDGTLSIFARLGRDDDEHTRTGTWRADGDDLVLVVTHQDGVPLPEPHETRARREKDRLVMETNDPPQRSRVVLRRHD